MNTEQFRRPSQVWPYLYPAEFFSTLVTQDKIPRGENSDPYNYRVGENDEEHTLSQVFPDPAAIPAPSHFLLCSTKIHLSIAFLPNQQP